VNVAVVAHSGLDGSGFGTRVQSMLKAYGMAGVDVDLYHLPFDHYPRLPEATTRFVKRYDVQTLPPLARRAQLGLLPPLAIACRDAARRWQSDTDYDVIQVETAVPWPAAKFLRGRARVLVMHDDDVVRVTRIARTTTNAARKVAKASQVPKYARLQKAALAEADETWFVSPDDLERLGGRSYARLVPNGAGDAFFDVPARTPSGNGPFRIAFVGPAFYEANMHGAEWFVRSIWPEVRAAQPAAQLAIVGRGWERSRLVGEPGVLLEGWVDELAGELARAHVVVAPLHSGGGTKIKVVEAMAAARPVVATPVGAEGLPPSPGLVVAPDAASFAERLKAWAGDSQAAEAAGRANRAVVEDYRWGRIWDGVLAALAELDART
jgi:glycosyltransferase involved in cell wall biosynthesis